VIGGLKRLGEYAKLGLTLCSGFDLESPLSEENIENDRNF
jgi:hypothetical protein